MTTGLIAGILFILLSPGLWDRVKNDLVEHPFVPALLIVGGNIAWLYLILLGWKVIGIFRRKNSFTRHQWFLHSLIACTILATAAGCWRVQGISPVYRLWWLASALSVAGLVILLKPYLKGIFFKFLAISMGVCALINLGYSAYIQSRLCREFHDVIALFRASPDGYVYFDLKYPGRPYLLSMRKVQRNLFFDDWDTGYGDIYRTDGNALGILPTYFRSDAWQDSLPQQPGAVINSGGHLIARLPDIVRKSDAWLYVTDNSGREITLRVQQVPLPGVIGYAYLRPYWDYRGEMTDLQPIRCFADSQEGEN